MIHSIACNSRDCPWYRRGGKCRHPEAKTPDVARHDMKKAPPECPVRDNPQVLIVTEDRLGRIRPKHQLVRVVREVDRWIKVLDKVAK